MKSDSENKKRVKSPYMRAIVGVSERKMKDRTDILILDKNGKELYPSEKVVPNKALKPRDVIQRFTKGLPNPEVLNSKPVWLKEDATHDSPDLESFNRMDAMERKDFARSARVRVRTRKKEEPLPPQPPVSPS